MTYNEIPGTGERISDISLGTYKMGGTDWGPVNDFDSIRTIQYCVDHGVNLIDSASGYGMGRAEYQIRYALDDDDGKRRGKTLVQTKIYLWHDRREEKTRSVSPADQADFIVGCQTRLGMKPIDLVLLHRDDTVTPIEEAIEALAGFQASGDVRMIGASNYVLEHLQRAQKTAPLQMYQPRFSMIDTALRDDGRLSFCHEHGIAVGVYSTLERGFFAPRLKRPDEYPAWDSRSNVPADVFAKRQRAHDELSKIAARRDCSIAHLAIAWALSHPGVTTVHVGASTPEQAEHLLLASGFRIDQREIEDCEAIIRDAGLKT